MSDFFRDTPFVTFLASINDQVKVMTPMLRSSNQLRPVRSTVKHLDNTLSLPLTKQVLDSVPVIDQSQAD